MTADTRDVIIQLSKIRNNQSSSFNRVVLQHQGREKSNFVGVEQAAEGSQLLVHIMSVLVPLFDKRESQKRKVMYRKKCIIGNMVSTSNL